MTAGGCIGRPPPRPADCRVLQMNVDILTGHPEYPTRNKIVRLPSVKNNHVTEVIAATG